MPVEWFILQGDQQQGPISSSHLKQLADQRKISPDTPIKSGSHGDWVAARTIEGLFSEKVLSRSAATTPAGPAPQTAETTPRPSPQPAPQQLTSQQPAPQQPTSQQPTPQQPAAQQPTSSRGAPQPPASPQPGAAELPWYVQAPEGQQYGPATKSQLDGWVAEGRVDATCQLWCQGWDRWQLASIVYPDLARPAGVPQAVPGSPAGSPTAPRGPSAAAAAGTADPLIGQTLGRFQILQRIGSGGMGVVYKGHQPALDRPVVVRVLPGARDARFLERFQGEIRAAAALVHPNIVEIYDIGQDRGVTYIAMELVEGGSLGDLLHRQGRLEVSPALQTMKQVALALATAHARGVIHQDVNPSNILLSKQGVAKVADFGLSLRFRTDLVTAGGEVPATAPYMSPEAAAGGRLDGRSDLYSLGATFYHVLAGRPPLEDQTGTELAGKHLQEIPRPLTEAAPGLPTALCRVIDRLLSKEPAARYQNAEELLAALGQLGVPLPVRRRVSARKAAAGSASEAAEAVGPSWPIPRIALVGGLLAVTAALLVVLALLLGRGCRPGEPQPQPGGEESAPAPAETAG